MKNFTFSWLIASLLNFSFATAQPVFQAIKTHITFFAGTAIEDIDATNENAISFFNISTGEVRVRIPNKDFHFKRPLMEEHFNENYMESGKFPYSEFKGKLDSIQTLARDPGLPHDVTVTGTLLIHGVSQQRTLPARVTYNNGRILVEMQFTIALVDYAIERPKILWEKLAENVAVKASLTYEPYKK